MTDFIDLKFRGSDRVIATAVLPGPDGVTLIDPGPASCLPALEAGLHDRGLSLRDVRTLLLTHIHLDHAGATGAIVERVPAIRVHVHERGAPHMVDPAKLLASATRLYGEQMDSLWGAFLPVPADRVTALQGGERLPAGGATLRVAYTPGHAKHHVSYLDEATGTAYVGDTGGIRVSGDFLLAPTPPPDIDLAAWRGSLDVITAWRPVALFLTHFGPITPAPAHLARFRETLSKQGEMVRELQLSGNAEEENMRVFVERLREAARRELSEDQARAAELAAPFDQLWQGLSRYWLKQQSTP
jgi:glyoxylase-like metal-dependent hydrolase (beta-lactamase superfamily II)